MLSPRDQHGDSALMLGPSRSITVLAILAAAALALAGCGTTRSTDTNRTATEQLLISDAIDRAIQTMDVHTLSGQTVFLDDSKVSDCVDKNYLVSTLRQYLLANRCQLKDQKDQADFIVEARAGAVGTDRNDLLFGLPSMNVPQIPVVQPVPAVIPEIPIAKRRDQRGVAKIAIFAYHRQTGTPVWQSGIVHEESSANDVWILGAGPFQRGTIYQGTEFAGNSIGKEQAKAGAAAKRLPPVGLAQQSVFTPPTQFAKSTPPAADPKVVQAAHQEPAAAKTPAPATAPAAPAASPPTATTSKPPASPQTASQPAPPPPANGPAAATADLSASVDPKKTQSAESAYLKPMAPETLPQPRFNSPQ